MDDPIERVERMQQQVRMQVLARLAFPWRFEPYPLEELADPRTEEVEVLVRELDHQCRQSILGEEEF